MIPNLVKSHLCNCDTINSSLSYVECALYVGHVMWRNAHSYPSYFWCHCVCTHYVLMQVSTVSQNELRQQINLNLMETEIIEGNPTHSLRFVNSTFECVYGSWWFSDILLILCVKPWLWILWLFLCRKQRSVHLLNIPKMSDPCLYLLFVRPCEDLGNVRPTQP